MRLNGTLDTNTRPFFSPILSDEEILVCGLNKIEVARLRRYSVAAHFAAAEAAEEEPAPSGSPSPSPGRNGDEGGDRDRGLLFGSTQSTPSKNKGRPSLARAVGAVTSASPFKIFGKKA